MNREEVLKDLTVTLPGAVIHEVKFHQQITLETSCHRLKELLRYIKKNGYRVLMDLTAVDYLKPKIQTKVLYWLHNPDTLERIRVIVFLERESPLPSVVDLWRGADWYERELFDLFGIPIEGHPELKRILMPDDWEGHPMRKDYPLTEESVQFKHGVTPKIPSEIIPNVKNTKQFNQFGTYGRNAQ